jgi:hypothetical protein
MSEYQEPEDAGLAEGGGSGGGSESVEYERQRVSPLRGPTLVFILILAVIILMLPVLRIFGLVSIGPPLGAVWAIVVAIMLVIVIATLYFLFSKNVGASV